MKKLLNLIFHRAVLFGASIIVQIAVLVAVIWKFNEYFLYFYSLFLLLSAVALVRVLNSKSNPSYKIAWIIPILVFPIFGGIFYITFGNKRLSKNMRAKMKIIEQKTIDLMNPQDHILEEIARQSATAVNQSRYIRNYSYCPPFKNTGTEFFPLGEDMFGRFLEELESAERYIFLEYFIIQEGIMWDAVLDILVKKAKAGVDVRVMFDDMGCIMLLPRHYDRKLRSMGIKCSVFNPLIPILSSRINTRDHRKIAVIDGHTGFTGGVNLADEYINLYEKHGHWKDTAIMLKGDAVWSLTVTFLIMWDYVNGTNADYLKYRPETRHDMCMLDDGYVQHFTDNPLDDEAVGETVYLNMINKAQRYVYITTPYLIIGNEMNLALSTAAKAGVDVRILTPSIGDKWYVHAVTRTYYEDLMKSGVKIYEYAPGFVHAKTIVADDELGIVGTINLDYRSLYLHFECGVWLYKTRSVLQMRDDYLKTLEASYQVSKEDLKKIKWYKKLAGSALRMFAPLM